MAKSAPSTNGPPQPVDWGKDALSEYFSMSYQNRIASFVNKSDAYQKFLDIDSCFAKISEAWTNPRPIVPALLLIRAHCAYRAACEAALAGQTVEAFIMIRALLEASGYAAHISINAGLDEIWLRRHDSDPKHLKAAKDEFTVGKVRSSIEKRDKHTASRFINLYDTSIEFGAHPNERSISGNLDKIDHQDSVVFNLKMLQGDGVALDHALLTVARAGVCSLDILQIPFGARFELLGVRKRALELRTGL